MTMMVAFERQLEDNTLPFYLDQRLEVSLVTRLIHVAHSECCLLEGTA